MATTINGYNFHNAADLFNMIQGDEWKAFKADVLARGILDPVRYVEKDGEKVYTDGRNRVKAVMELREEGHDIALPEQEEDSSKDSDVFQLVLSRNLHGRRHLTSIQKAAIAAKAGILYERIVKEETGKSFKGDIAQFIADLVGTNRTYIFKARNVYRLRRAMLDQIIAGKMSIKEAEDQIAADERAKRGITDETIVDGTDNPADPRFHDEMAARDSFATLGKMLKDCRLMAGQIAAGTGADWLDAKELLAWIENAETHVAASAPHAVCPVCDGAKKVNDPAGGRRKIQCGRCNGHGYVNAARYQGEPTGTVSADANGEAEEQPADDAQPAA